MKVLIYIFLALAAGLLIFNLYHVNFEEPLEGESFAAMVGVGASLCAIILLTILKIALNIKEKLKG
jgi:phosphoglycerol transferase MdoB-like AlkP superfamily enzyme